MVPAYLRAPVEPKKLPLPPPHELLCKFFDELETAVRYMRSRSRPGLLSKCKQLIEANLRRSFEISHLEQIVFIYPEAFSFKAMNPSESWERSLNLLIEIRESDVPETFLDMGRSSEKRLAVFRKRLFAHAKPFLVVCLAT